MNSHSCEWIIFYPIVRSGIDLLMKNEYLIVRSDILESADIIIEIASWGGGISVKYRRFSSKKLSKMKLELILKVELEVEVGVFSLQSSVGTQGGAWRIPSCPGRGFGM